MQIALYARVSTTRQAENELSIPDQLRQMHVWAERNGHTVVKEYIEPGNTATDDKRPAFQEMMAEGTLKGTSPYQLIVVHSFSRFFRNMIEGALYERKLRKNDIKLVSITQHTNDDSAGEMQRHIIMMFDEYQSKETAKHVLRGMQENARQGYYNGSQAPFGYKTIDAGQTGTRGRFKKKLEIEPVEADVVRDIYAMYVTGINAPRMGMKDIANTLNAKGLTMRGKLWRIQNIHIILSSLTYSGWHVFNKRDSKTSKIKDKSEWIKVAVPAIVSQDIFEQATKLRNAYTPIRCAPRRETSPTLLTGLLKCDCCGGNMVLITAKNNRYHYYKCSNRISKGNSACNAQNYPMEKLDTLVLDAFKQKVYTNEHIRAVIDELRHLTNKHGGADKERVKKLEAELKDIETAENKLFEGVEKGVFELDDRLKTRIQQHKTRRETVAAELVTLQQKHQTPLQTLTPQKIEAVSRVLNKRFSTSTPFSRAYLKATVNEIRVSGDLMKLRGENRMMADLVAANGSIDPDAGVHRFIQRGAPTRLIKASSLSVSSSFAKVAM